MHSTCVSPNSTSTEPSACFVNRRVKLTRAQLIGRASAGSASRSWRFRRVQRTQAAAEVLSLPAPTACTARSRQLEKLLLERRTPAGKRHGDSSSSSPAQKPSVQTSKTSFGSSGAARAERHVGKERVAAEAALDEVAHRMRQRLVGGDQRPRAAGTRHGCDRGVRLKTVPRRR